MTNKYGDVFMDTVVVTLRYDADEYDLALPTAVPLAQLAPILQTELGFDDGQLSANDILVGRNITSGVTVRPEQTLGMAGVAHGDILELTPMPNSAPATRKPTDSTWGRPYLQSVAANQTFTLQGRSIQVGRGSQSDVNISRLPGGEVVSRKHAQLIRRPDGFWLKDARSKNGTLLDGQKLQPDDYVKLNNGNRIRFGIDGPELIFYDG